MCVRMTIAVRPSLRIGGREPSGAVDVADAVTANVATTRPTRARSGSHPSARTVTPGTLMRDSPAAPVAQVTAVGAGPNSQDGRPVGGTQHAQPTGWPVGCKAPVGAANQQGQGQPAVGGQSGPHGQTSGQGHGSLMVSPPCGSRRLQRGRVQPGREARPPARHWRAGRRRGVRRDARRRGRTRAGRSDGSTCSTGFRRPIGRARRTIEDHSAAPGAAGAELDRPAPDRCGPGYRWRSSPSETCA